MDDGIVGQICRLMYDVRASDSVHETTESRSS